MYHTSFIRIAQKVNSAEFINNKSILERMPFLLAAVIQFSVDFITWTMNGTFYAVMDKRGVRAAVGGGSSRNRRVSSSAVRAGRRCCRDSA